MSKCTLRNVEFLKKLSKCNKATRDKLIVAANKDQLHCLTEIAYNTIKGKLKHDHVSVKKLKKFRTEIRNLAKKSISLKKKREIIAQRGGFIPLLLSPIISAIVSSVLSKVI